MMMRNMFAKYFGRESRHFSTISTSSSSSSIAKRAWDEQKFSVLLMAFSGGFICHGYTNFQKKKKRWYDVKRKYEEVLKRDKELDARRISARVEMSNMLMSRRKSKSKRD